MKLKRLYIFSLAILFNGDVWSVFGSSEVKIVSKRFKDKTTWENWSMNQGATSTCASHAVAHALSYCHPSRDLYTTFDGKKIQTPKILHKKVQKWLGRKEDLQKGLSVEDVMKFLIKSKIASYPGGPCIYGFETFLNVFTSTGVRGNTKVQKIKYMIKKYSIPVVVACISSSEVQKSLHQALKSKSLPAIECEDGRHAMVFYGYNDRENHFYVKNSWGGNDKKLSCKWVEQWIDKAYIGWSRYRCFGFHNGVLKSNLGNSIKISKWYQKTICYNNIENLGGSSFLAISNYRMCKNKKNLSLKMLGLERSDSPYINLLKSRKITILSCLGMGNQVRLTIKNNSTTPLRFKVPKGIVFESGELSNFCNLVTKSDEEFAMDIGTARVEMLEAYCVEGKFFMAREPIAYSATPFLFTCIASNQVQSWGDFREWQSKNKRA